LCTSLRCLPFNMCGGMGISTGFCADNDTTVAIRLCDERRVRDPQQRLIPCLVPTCSHVQCAYLRGSAGASVGEVQVVQVTQRDAVPHVVLVELLQQQPQLAHTRDDAGARDAV
jgi:hypothetical protein